MKRYLETLTTVLLAGVLFLGLGATLGAQDYPSARQQPMEIPAQYPQYPPQQNGPGGPPSGPQQQPNGPQQGDPGAARISFIQGDVQTQHSDSGDWVAATVNTPVVSGDHVSTGNGARAEIQLDHANILRLSDQSVANVVSLSRTQIQLQVSQGLVNYDVMKNSEAAVEIQTPNVAIHPQAGEGSFRVLVNSDGETIVDVRKGSAEISTPQGSTRVERDQRITIQGNADNAQYQVSGAPGRDDWDKWNSDRDRTIETAQSWQHTNPYYTGTQDLDANGQWNDVPDYGAVWFPSADPGWAPYRDGRWVFEPYYGWTWVSYEPWGWAPYHYGRWFVYGGRWGWWPGPVYGGYRPLWAPAYVSFLGFGGRGWGVGVGFGFGGGFGSVGWLPIGPGDRFYPWYGRGVTNVNVVNVYNIHNERGGFEPLRGGPNAYSNVNRAFTDDRVRGGISSMQASQFGRGRVPMQQSRVDAGSFRQASFMTGRNPVSPSSESFRSSDRQVNPGAIPNRANSNQRFFSGNSSRQVASGTQGNFSRSGNFTGSQAAPNGARTGFHSFGSVNSNNANPGSRPGAFTPPSSPQGQQGQSSRPAWRPFNPPTSQPQANVRGGTVQGQAGGQSRQAPYQPAQSEPRAQNYSRGNSVNYGYSRPQLNMQQPVVTPRSYPTPSVRSVPSGGGYNSGSNGNSGGGYRGAPSGGSNRGGYSGGGTRGGSSSGGGHASSGHSHR